VETLVSVEFFLIVMPVDWMKWIDFCDKHFLITTTSARSSIDW
jgi:hypothetical protein